MEMAFLAAERKIAIADAKLKAIEQAIEEEDIGDKIEIADIPNAKSEERTSTWPNSMSPETHQPGADLIEQKNPFKVRIPEKPPAKSRAVASQLENNEGNDKIAHQTFNGSLITSTPINFTGSQLIETLTSVNEQIVAGLARQNLPKCHPYRINAWGPHALPSQESRVQGYDIGHQRFVCSGGQLPAQINQRI